MHYNWMDDYLLNKRSVTKDFQPVWNWIRYHIGGKMFAAVCLDDQNQPYYINLKVDPTEGEFQMCIRDRYYDICIDTGTIGFEEAVTMICSLYNCL